LSGSARCFGGSAAVRGSTGGTSPPTLVLEKYFQNLFDEEIFETSLFCLFDK
jgi:hypothetical protein